MIEGNAELHSDKNDVEITIPVKSWILRNTPSKTPMFHRVEIWVGVGKSMRKFLIIFVRGVSLDVFIFIRRMFEWVFLG